MASYTAILHIQNEREVCAECFYLSLMTSATNLSRKHVVLLLVTLIVQLQAKLLL